MKVIMVNSKNKIEQKVNVFLEWIIYMLVYAAILWMASQIFKSLYIKNFLVGFIASIIIYILNKTLKPFLVSISLPLIGMSLGLFYFAINVFILVLTDLIMGKSFYLTGFFSPFLISIFISVVNVIIDTLIVKPLIERCERRK